MELKLITENEDKMKLESLRNEVFHLNGISSYYINELLNGKTYAMAAIDNDNMVGGCYFHRFNTILLIDELFVKEDYQNTGLQVGRNLVKELILNKSKIEELLESEITLCKLEASNEKAKALYSKIGFKASKFDDSTFIKAL